MADNAFNAPLAVDALSLLPLARTHSCTALTFHPIIADTTSSIKLPGTPTNPPLWCGASCASTYKLSTSHTTHSATIMAEQSINIPQVLVFIVVTILAVRWYFSKPTPESTRAAPNRSAARINPAQIEQVAQMFPQLDRRNIAWDLQRNGGNVAATTERALSGRGLDNVSHYARFRTLRKVKSC